MDKQSIKSFFQIFNYMEDPCIHGLRKTNQNKLEFFRVECKKFESIDLELIKYQRLVECWAVN